MNLLKEKISSDSILVFLVLVLLSGYAIDFLTSMGGGNNHMVYVDMALSMLILLGVIGFINEKI